MKWSGWRLATLTVAVGAATTAAEESVSTINLTDTLWVLIAAFLVFFMNAGFAFLETGFCRTKNAVNILAKNFMVFALAAVAYWAVGYGLMFGSAGGFIGVGSFLVDEQASSPVSNIPVLAFFFFQLAFASAGCSITSGAVAERIRFGAYLLFAVVLTAVLYPLTGHWIWGGGWLAQIGFHDFAGSTAVHSVGGWAALAGILLLGPRVGKFRPDGSPRVLMGHSIPLATLGAFILWLGWFGFNPGSELAMTANVPRIALTTALASCAGVIGAMLTVWWTAGKPDFSMIINGCLAGLVAITAGCAVVTPAASLAIGGLAGVIVVFAVYWFERLRIDDPVGALAVHLVNGVWGTLAVGLFARPGYVSGVEGLLYGGGVRQLLSQTIGVIAVGATAFSLSLAVWAVLRATIGLRVNREEEIAGLDVGEMGMEAYSGFQVFTTEN